MIWLPTYSTNLNWVGLIRTKYQVIYSILAIFGPKFVNTGNVFFGKVSSQLVLGAFQYFGGSLVAY